MTSAGTGRASCWRERRRAENLPTAVRVIPAGQVLARFVRTVDARGGVDGVSGARDLFRDTIHLNDLGAYLVALTHYAVLYRRSPIGLPRQLLRADGTAADAPAAETARLMQEVVWDVVTEYPKTGVPQAEAGLPMADLPAFDPSHHFHEVKVVEERPAGAPAERAPASVQVSGGPAAPSLAMGLAGIADWTTEQPFIDLMKTARPWTGHLPGQWGGWDHAALAAAGSLDEAGWPRFIPPELTGISTLILTEQPAGASSLAGRYRLTYQGTGTIELEGRVGNVVRRPGDDVVRLYAGRRLGHPDRHSQRPHRHRRLPARNPGGDGREHSSPGTRLDVQSRLAGQGRGSSRHPLHGLDGDQRLSALRRGGSPAARRLHLRVARRAGRGYGRAQQRDRRGPVVHAAASRHATATCAPSPNTSATT